MRKSILLITLVGINFIFSNLESTPSFLFRRIKDRNFIPLYETGTFLYKEFGNNKFTLNEVMERAKKAGLPGFTYPHAYYKLELFVRTGVLGIERGKPNYYYFLAPFNTLQNLQLLSSISELHRAVYYSQEIDSVEESIKAKLEVIKTAIDIEAKGIIKVKLSSDLEKFPEIKMKFLIGIVSQKMVDLYKSFSEILIKKEDRGYPFRVDMDYRPERIVVTLPAYPLEYVYEESPLLSIIGVEPEKIECDLMWDWLGSEHFRRELVQAIIQSDLQLEALLSPLESYFFGGITLLYGTLPGIMVRRFPLLEKFVIRRKERKFVKDYNNFISLAKEILKIRLVPVNNLSLTEKKVLILRYGIDDPINPEPGRARQRKEVAELLGITREAVRLAEIRAREKLKLNYEDEIKVNSYLLQIEEILDKIEEELENP